MKSLVQEKEKAILLRKKGLSYNEILQEVQVAKSSLSLWLKDLPLTSREKSVLKVRKDSNISRGRIKAASVLHQNKLDRESAYYEEAVLSYEAHKNDPLFLVGISLYWAEGARRSNQFMFVNTDIEMIQMMLFWIEKYTNYTRSDCGYRLFVHKFYAHEKNEAFWAKRLQISTALFKKTVFKATDKQIKTRPEYKGCMRIEVPRSRALLCKMKFWKNMMVDSYLKG